MKDSYFRTPRTLNECQFTPGYTSGHVSPETRAERIGGYILAVAIGVGLAACLFFGWSS